MTDIKQTYGKASSASTAKAFSDNIKKVIEAFINSGQLRIANKIQNFYRFQITNNEFYVPISPYAVLYDSEYVKLLSIEDCRLNIDRLIQLFLYIKINITIKGNSPDYIKGTCIKQEKKVAEELNINAHTMCRYLQKLKELGLIAYKPVRRCIQKNGKKDYYTTTVYVTTTDEDWEKNLNAAVQKIKSKNITEETND